MSQNDNKDETIEETEKKQEEKPKQSLNLVSKGYPAPSGIIRPKKKFV